MLRFERAEEHLAPVVGAVPRGLEGDDLLHLRVARLCRRPHRAHEVRLACQDLTHAPRRHPDEFCNGGGAVRTGGDEVEHGAAPLGSTGRHRRCATGEERMQQQPRPAQLHS